MKYLKGAKLLTAITLNDPALTGKSIGIDISLQVYRWISVQPLANTRGEPTAHIRHLIFMVTRMRQAGINPIFVFDGTPHPNKHYTIERRAAAVTARTHKPSDYLPECRHLIGLLGCEYINADNEADTYLAQMYRAGEIAAVYSMDTDFIAYGVPMLVDTGPRKLALITPATIAAALGLTAAQLTLICILSGTDYSDGRYRFGIVKGVSAAKNGTLGDESALIGDQLYAWNLFTGKIATGGQRQASNKKIDELLKLLAAKEITSKEVHKAVANV